LPTLARVRMRTGPDPAAIQAFVQAIKVAPDVITSSMSRIGRSFKTPPLLPCGSIASSSMLYRASRLKPSSDAVLLVRTNASGHQSSDSSFDTARASNADWLYRRFNNRDQCNGTGTTSVPSSTWARIIFAIQRPAGLAISCRSPCLKASTSLRPVPSYKSAARPCTHGRGACIQPSQ